MAKHLSYTQVDIVVMTYQNHLAFALNFHFIFLFLRHANECQVYFLLLLVSDFDQIAFVRGLLQLRQRDQGPHTHCLLILELLATVQVYFLENHQILIKDFPFEPNQLCPIQNYVNQRYFHLHRLQCQQRRHFSISEHLFNLQFYSFLYSSLFVSLSLMQLFSFSFHEFLFCVWPFLQPKI